MSRYIDADKFIERLNASPAFPNMGTDGYFLLGVVEDLLKSFPTADVVEVRHGTWYHGTEYGAVYAKCSACGRKMNYSCYGYAYCALCGAKMDGERSENGKS
jgi:hypothetical protein